MMPTFLGIGAQKCASTWLHQIVSLHPAVNVPAVKEIDFFSYYFDHGYQWYERLFKASDSAKHMGEVSPSYFHDPAAPARVLQYRPDIKILLTLRNPVQRALSNHRHEIRLRHMVGDDLSFEAGLANNPMYIEQGLYAKHLSNWLQYFPREQIFIMLVDDIEADPAGVARDVYRFLGIDETFQPAALATRFNQSVASRSETLFRAKARIYDLTRTRGLAWLWSAASGMGLRNLYRRMNIAGTDVPEPTMRAATERMLRKEFKADIGQLEQILDRSLAHWVSGDSNARTESQRSSRASEDGLWATR